MGLIHDIYGLLRFAEKVCGGSHQDTWRRLRLGERTG
jgi:hypothetical protein